MTEKVPFDDVPDVSAIILRIVQEPFIFPASDPSMRGAPGLRAILQGCWQRSPESRTPIDQCIACIQSVAEHVLTSTHSSECSPAKLATITDLGLDLPRSTAPPIRI